MKRQIMVDLDEPTHRFMALKYLDSKGEVHYKVDEDRHYIRWDDTVHPFGEKYYAREQKQIYLME